MEQILLYGPPGSGKSTIGKMLSDRLGLPWIDLDHSLESRWGLSIPQLMAGGGEEGFRDLETSMLKELVRSGPAVISLGGGSLLRVENRSLAEEHGIVIYLAVELQTLVGRLQADSHARPLLEGDLEEKLTSLLAARAAHYRSFRLQVRADQTPDQVTWQIQMALGRFHLSAMGEYDLIVQSHALDRLGSMLRQSGVQQPLLVTDEHVAKLCSQEVLDSLRHSNYEPQMLTIPPGESSKSLKNVESLWNGFLEAGLDRTSTVIALGGGVVTDMTGFAAATFMRGLDWVCIPTTLLCMVDASMGGKTGFDLPQGKNLVGAFHAPQLVLADPELLRTLPDPEFRAGLAEVVKHGIIADPILFDLCRRGLESVKALLAEVICRAVAVKVQIIEQDPYEHGQRASLNLGHTVGHAIEIVSQFCVGHGEAVAMGMVAEAKLAERLSIARHGLSAQIAEALSSLGLPVEIPKELSQPELIGCMRLDKKKAGGIARFALPVEIGRVQVNVELKDLRLVFEES